MDFSNMHQISIQNVKKVVLTVQALLIISTAILNADDVFLYNTVKFPFLKKNQSAEQQIYKFLESYYPQAFDTLHNIRNHTLTNRISNKEFIPHQGEQVIVICRGGKYFIDTVNGFYTRENVSGCRDHIFFKLNKNTNVENVLAYIRTSENNHYDEYFKLPDFRILPKEDNEIYINKLAKQIKKYMKAKRYANNIGNKITHYCPVESSDELCNSLK